MSIDAFFTSILRKKITSHYIFKDPDIEHMKTAFRMLDKNGDGKINLAEVQEMIAKLGMKVNEEAIKSFLLCTSDCGEALIDENQFLGIMNRFVSNDLPADDLAADLKAAFQVFDKDSNGFITIDELQQVLEMINEKLAEEEVRKLLLFLDTDKDGKINYHGDKII